MSRDQRGESAMSTELPEAILRGDWKNWEIVSVGPETWTIDKSDEPITTPTLTYVGRAASLDTGGGLGVHDDCHDHTFCVPDEIVIPLPSGTIRIPIKLCRKITICLPPWTPW
jgi:hypothetical protein